MLQVIEGGRGTGPPAQNEELQAAIVRITTGEGHLGILDDGEAEVLYRTLREMHFTPAQFEQWTAALIADHPYERAKRVGSDPSLWVWIKYIVTGGEKPTSTQTTESVQDWRKRVEAYVAEQIVLVAAPEWLERHLAALDAAREEVAQQTGKTQWTTPVMRWALIQLLTITGNPRSAHVIG